MGGKYKDGVVTFKADEKLIRATSGPLNRSGFILQAPQPVMEVTLPGGTLTSQRMHHRRTSAQGRQDESRRQCQLVPLVCAPEGPGGYLGEEKQ